MKINIQQAFNALSNDPEFLREIRYFNGTVKMNMGDDSYLILIQDGKPVNATDEVGTYATVTVEMTGTDDMWENLLARKPIPYYQCLQTTVVKHGMKMSNNVETLAYLPAWNRMIFVLRDLLN